MTLSKLLFNNKGKTIPNELNEFNWGAFLLPAIWGIKYKIWFTLLIIPLFLYQLPNNLNWIAIVIFQLYCGIKGNEWAYQEDFWMKPKNFRITQMKWAAIALTFNIICPIIILTITANFLKKPENLGEIINNTLCVNTQKILKQTLPKMTIDKYQTSSDIAKNFASKHTSAIVENNEVTIFFKKIKSAKIKLIFYKSNEKPCNMNNGNCEIRTYYDIPEQYGFSRYCTFYFDNYKRIQPDNLTKKSISKGNNIFKYIKF